MDGFRFLDVGHWLAVFCRAFNTKGFRNEAESKDTVIVFQRCMSVHDYQVLFLIDPRYVSQDQGRHPWI